MVKRKWSNVIAAYPEIPRDPTFILLGFPFTADSKKFLIWGVRGGLNSVGRVPDDVKTGNNPHLKYMSPTKRGEMGKSFFSTTMQKYPCPFAERVSHK
jgi:hypothetical protein